MSGLPLTAEQQAWFAMQEGKDTRNPNPCVGLYGLLVPMQPSDPKRFCKECRLFIRKTGYSKTYLKCGLRDNTNGPGTDHRANWDACGRFVLKK